MSIGLSAGLSLGCRVGLWVGLSVGLWSWVSGWLFGLGFSVGLAVVARGVWGVPPHLKALDSHAQEVIIPESMTYVSMYILPIILPTIPRFYI